MITVLCYKNCSTCKRALKYLDDKNIDYTYREIKEEKPSYDELKSWYMRSGLELKRFYNTSGALYKERHLKEKFKEMNEDEILRYLATDGMLVKRPILISDDKILVGFKPHEWEEYLK